jgi:hypothetical protein
VRGPGHNGLAEVSVTNDDMAASEDPLHVGISTWKIAAAQKKVMDLIPRAALDS